MLVNESKVTVRPVIMAGGAGTRLWPLSRAMHPKQFLPLIGEKTMLQQTVERLKGLEVLAPVVICNEEHRFFVAEQLREIDSLGPIILEPKAKNTAPAIALAALLEEDPDTLILILSADHAIKNTRAFNDAVVKALGIAGEGRILTFGVSPSEPHTGYGYIKVGAACGEGFEVDEFREKPDRQTAESYLASGDYYWNSGIFLARVSTYLTELEKYSPEIFGACRESIRFASRDADFIRPDSDKFNNCPSDSIDYAVMEKTNLAAMIAMDCDWSDVGSWSSLWDVSSKDNDGNVCVGDVMLDDTEDTFVRSDDKLVAAVGVRDLVIVVTKDAVLVTHKNCTQNTKHIVAQLKQMDRSEWEVHREVYRPWGKYDSIDKGDRYQAKRITVKPGARLSIQKHHHRAEHWVVVSGTANVTIGDRSFIMQENESTYIPIGEVHSLENPGKVPLEIIEIQTGSYLGEDDIVRLNDIYGRA